MMKTLAAAAIVCFAGATQAGAVDYVLTSHGTLSLSQQAYTDLDQAKAFCQSNSCSMNGSAVVAMTPDLEGAMRAINRQVNAQITYRSDHGDTWEIPTRTGDCEDFVLLKRQRLIEAGFPAKAVRIALLNEGGGHAVLLVQTDKGTFTLDNRSDRIRDAMGLTKMIAVQDSEVFHRFRAIEFYETVASR